MRGLFLLLLVCQPLLATPTSLYWTNTTTDVQDTKKLLIGVNTYFSVFKSREGQTLPADVGFLYGLFEWNQLKGEVGVDYLEATDGPIYFNGKVGLQEGKLFNHAPSFSLGVFNVGTRLGLTHQNVVNVVLGKSLSDKRKCRFFMAAYAGNKALGRDRTGLSVGFDYAMGHVEAKEGREAYDKWLLVADYCTGKNALGGGGAGLIYFFTPDVSLVTGPLFFNEAKVNGSWKWTFQLYVDKQF